MNKKTLLIFFAVILSLFPYLKISADENLEFQLALRMYESLQYNEALKKFEKLASEDYHSKTTISTLFLAKTQLNLDKLDAAEETLKKFRELYPNSAYADEARLTLAKVYYQKEDYSNTFYELLYLSDKSKNDFYRDYARTTAEKIGVNYLSGKEVSEMLSVTTLEKVKSLLMLVKGKLLLREDKFKDAELTFLELLQEYPASDESTEALALYKKAMEGKKEVVQQGNSIVAALLPLSRNTSSNVAKEILEGIKYAFSEFNSGREEKIGLLIKDTELDSDKMQRIKVELSEVPAVKTIIGPVFSNEVKDALDKFQSEKIAIVSPTATDNDLTVMYDNFFQANPDFTTRGKAMAQYVYYVENKRRMGVLNAFEGYSLVLAAAFVSEFERLGGQIVVKETYKSNSFDLATPVNRIAGFMSSIDGLYVPLADKADAPVILSQLVQSGINLPMYGNQDWMNAKGFETSPLLSNQLTFTSDYFIDYNSPDFQEFSDSFLNKTRTNVNRNILYGYDTAKYILTVLRSFYASKDMVKDKMESGITSNGFHNNISFDEKRTNRFLNIVRYKDGKFELVDEFKVKN